MLKRSPLLAPALYVFISGSLVAAAKAQVPPPASSGVRILSFASDITVRADSTLLVRETLEVLANGPKAGVDRDLATHYQDRFSNPYTVHADVVSLERDGRAVEPRLERIAGGLRVRLGRREDLAPAGEHHFELIYVVDRGIGFFPDHDELYWNVTGTGSPYPLESVTATLHLPRGIAPAAILLDGYTGVEGSAETAFAASVGGPGAAAFHATRGLGSHESLTIVARWPKGFVRPPTDDQNSQYFLEDYKPILIGMAGVLLVTLYYVVAWFVAGRKPAHHESELCAEPPGGFSPAALRYFRGRAFDQKTLVAALVDLAIKRQFAILEDGSGSYILGRMNSAEQPASTHLRGRNHSAAQIAADEKLILARLFAASDTIRLEPASHNTVGGAAEALRSTLQSTVEKYYLRANARYLAPGVVISLATAVSCGVALQGVQKLQVFCLALGLLPWSILFLATASRVADAWRYALANPQHPPSARRHAGSLTAIWLYFTLGELVLLDLMLRATSMEVAAVLLLLAGINFLFHLLVRGPSRLGRALTDEIERFGSFLTTTEKDVQAPIKTTSQQFERLLPYALALNVESIWGEKFAATLAQAKGKDNGYTPGWYFGEGWNRITVATFATLLGTSLSSAITLATRTPARPHRSVRRR